MATLTRLLGDLEAAEDAVQEACALAVDGWPATGVPPNPGAWLIGVARHKAVDRVRRERRRAGKEAAACADPRSRGPGLQALGDDELALIFACCHPALDPAARMALTLRSVCGLSHGADRGALPGAGADDGAAAGPGQAQDPPGRDLVRACRGPPDLAGRLDAVLRVIYLVFTEGHRAAAARS